VISISLDTWHQFLLRRNTSLRATRGKMFKCRRLHRSLVCTICYPYVTYTPKSV